MKDDLIFFNDVFEALNTLGDFKVVKDSAIQEWFNKTFESVEKKTSKLSDYDLDVIANLYLGFCVQQERKMQETLFIDEDTVIH
tara:strand:+ start:1806 stop:2057 length:252 start_codon:yes stop_codon:yes gene_type:complete